MEKKFILKNPVKLSPENNLGNFDCGNHQLNRYLKKHAYINQLNNISTCYVVLNEEKVIAYYCVSIGSVDSEKAPDFLKEGLPKYPIPVLVLARLAVDKNYQNTGIGQTLIKEIFLKAVYLAKEIACAAIFVHAKDDKAKAFYKKMEFKEDVYDEYKLYIMVKDIIASL